MPTKPPPDTGPASGTQPDALSPPDPGLQRPPSVATLAGLGSMGSPASPPASGAPAAPHVAIHLARSVPIFGAFAPESFGDPAREHQHAYDAAAVSALPWLGHVLVTGVDRLSFLEATSTARFSGRVSGDSLAVTFATEAGTPVAFACAELTRDAVRLEVRTDRVEPLLQHLRAQQGEAQVELAPTAAWLVFTVVGPLAATVLSAVTGVSRETLAALRDDRWGTVTLAGVDARIRSNSRRIGRAALDVTVGAADGVATWDALVRGGAKALGASVLEALRVEAGRAELVVDLPLDRLLLAAPSLAATVDASKPRFTGRSALVAGDGLRAPDRTIVGLRLSAGDGSPPAAEGQPLRSEAASPADNGSEATVVGRLGTVASSPAQGTLALALVDRAHAAPGARLVLPSGAVAEVRGDLVRA